jgi:hypothetical protein
MLERVVVLLGSRIVLIDRFGLYFDTSDATDEGSEVEGRCRQ